jgi:hypothetical protein
VRDGGEELVAALRRLHGGGAQPGQLVDRFLQFADAKRIFVRPIAAPTA